jgi:hypothetical protein
MEALRYVKGKKQFKSVEKSLMEAVNKLQGGNVMVATTKKKGIAGKKKASLKFKKFGVSGEFLLEGRKILRESTGEDFEVASIDYNPESTMLEVTTSDGVIHEFEKEDATAVTPEDTMTQSAPIAVEGTLTEGEEPVEEEIPAEEFTEDPEGVDLDLEEDLDAEGNEIAGGESIEEEIPAEDVDTSVPLEECEDLQEGEDEEIPEEELVVPDDMEFSELQEGVTVGSDGDADVDAGEVNGAPKKVQPNVAGKMTKTAPKPGYDTTGIKTPDQVAVGKVSIGEDGYVMLEGVGATKQVRAKVKGRTMNIFKGRTLVEQVTLDKGDDLIECFKVVSKDYKSKVVAKKK